MIRGRKKKIPDSNSGLTKGGLSSSSSREKDHVPIMDGKGKGGGEVTPNQPVRGEMEGKSPFPILSYTTGKGGGGKKGKKEGRHHYSSNERKADALLYEPKRGGTVHLILLHFQRRRREPDLFSLGEKSV